MGAVHEQSINGQVRSAAVARSGRVATGFRLWHTEVLWHIEVGTRQTEDDVVENCSITSPEMLALPCGS